MNSATAARTVANASALTDASAPPRMDRTITGSMTCSQPSRRVDKVPSKSKTTWAGRASQGGSTITSISVPGRRRARAGISASSGL